MNHSDLVPGEGRHRFCCAGIGGSQGIENATDDRWSGSKRSMPCRGDGAGDAARHVSWSYEMWVVNINDWSWREAGCGVHQLREIDLLVTLRPSSQAFLKQPKAAYIAEEADPAVNSPLVGEVRCPDLVREDWSLQLRPDKRPGPRGHIDELRRKTGHRNHG
jgi:hypothetical protein